MSFQTMTIQYCPPLKADQKRMPLSAQHADKDARENFLKKLADSFQGSLTRRHLILDKSSTFTATYDCQDAFTKQETLIEALKQNFDNVSFGVLSEDPNNSVLTILATPNFTP